MEYKNYNDYELLSFVCEGNEDANNIIIEKYEPLINSYASKMLKHCNGNGLDYNDLRQEGFIGLNYAIKYFSEEKNVVFYTFVKKCIERRMISALIASNRQKYKLLNEAISFDNECNMLDKILKDDLNNPEVIIENLDGEEKLLNSIRRKLTDFEEQVFELMITDFNYKEIADILEKDKKAIDNAIQRIRNKVKETIKEQEKNI